MSVHYGSVAAGMFFILAGVGFLLEGLGYVDLSGRQVWPLLLIALGAAILVGGLGRRSGPE